RPFCEPHDPEEVIAPPSLAVVNEPAPAGGIENPMTEALGEPGSVVIVGLTELGQLLGQLVFGPGWRRIARVLTAGVGHERQAAGMGLTRLQTAGDGWAD